MNQDKIRFTPRQAIAIGNFTSAEQPTYGDVIVTQIGDRVKVQQGALIAYFDRGGNEVGP